MHSFSIRRNISGGLPNTNGNQVSNSLTDFGRALSSAGPVAKIDEIAMASQAELLDWQPAGRGSGYVFKRGQQFRFQRDGFSSGAFSSLAEANRLGWAQYREWCKQLPRGVKRQHAQQAAVKKKKPAPATGQKRKAQELVACSINQQDENQHTLGSGAGNPAAEAAATEVSTPAVRHSKKKRTADNPAAAAAAATSNQRNKKRAAAPVAAAPHAVPRRAWICPPASAAAAAVPQEGAGSNCASPAATAGVAPALAASAAVDPSFPSSVSVWRPGSSMDSGKRLQLRFVDTLGRGGFGEVHKVAVKVHGPDSLSTLKLRGNAGAAVRQLLASLNSSGSSTSSSRSSRTGAVSGSSSHNNTTSSSNSITMALKLAPPFIFTSWEMQQNYNHDAHRYNEHVKQRMLAEFNIMQSCAASPHIVDAFVAGTVLHYGTFVPALLMEFATHGDVEQAFLAQKLPDPWGLAGQQHGAGPYAQPAQQQQQHSIPRGLSSSITQRIVRAAAMGLRDLHKMAGHLHCDMKTNNLLVFGSADNPVIKLCDLGVCKRRSHELKWGPVSGTKDWQAPEQASAAGGPLDFCLDSWGLGLLVLGLRRGRRPFWWLQEVGVTPAEFATSLAASLGRPDSRYAQEDANQPGAQLGPLEVAFVQRCMAHSSVRQPPELLLVSDPYLSGRYRGG